MQIFVAIERMRQRESAVLFVPEIGEVFALRLEENMLHERSIRSLDSYQGFLIEIEREQLPNKVKELLNVKLSRFEYYKLMRQSVYDPRSVLD